jgi:predicted enzyme related to lactoylglutathione lyase
VDVVRLAVVDADDEVTMLATARGDTAEVFHEHARYDFATTGPIPGFLVEDVGAAADELSAAGGELLGDPGAWQDEAWRHFRAPDGFVYEVKSAPYDPFTAAPGLEWAGARSSRTTEMAEFAERVLGMRRTGEDPVIAHLRMANGDGFELFDQTHDEAHAFMDTGPTVAFGVEDLDHAYERLTATRVEVFLGGIRTDGVDRWVHFRAPDGCVYELVERGRGWSRERASSQ